MREIFFSFREQAVNRFKVAEKELLVYNGNFIKVLVEFLNGTWQMSSSIKIIFMFKYSPYCLQQNAVLHTNCKNSSLLLRKYGFQCICKTIFSKEGR